MSSKILSRAVSSLLCTYYFHIHPPRKFHIWRFLRRATDNARLTVRYAESGWITLDEEDYLQGEIFRNGFYELEVWESLKNFVTDREVFWDVGANIGAVAIRAIIDPLISKVYCFEPNTATFDVLEMNLSMNKGTYDCYKIALSDSCSELELYFGTSENKGLASLEQDWGCGSEITICRTIDSMLENEKMSPPTLMKIDVEGWEEQVLRGASRLLKNSPPKAIVFESSCDENGKMTGTHLESLLVEAGYEINRIPRTSGPIQGKENYVAHRATGADTEKR